MQAPAIWRSLDPSLKWVAAAARSLPWDSSRGHDAWGIDNNVDRLASATPASTRSGSIQPGKRGCSKETRVRARLSRIGSISSRASIHRTRTRSGRNDPEMLRIAKPGGYVVLFAPDYRAPFEAHYEIPWPPFFSRELCKSWLDGFDRPYGGLDHVLLHDGDADLGYFEPLNCQIVNAYNDRKIEPQAMRNFDCSTLKATFDTARKFRTRSRLDRTARELS